MNNTRILSKHSSLFFLVAGVILFILGLFNRKSRTFLIKFLGFTGRLMTDYTMAKNLSRFSFKPVGSIPAVMPLYGYKGGRAVKKRTFKHLYRTSEQRSEFKNPYFNKYSVSEAIRSTV